MSGADAYGRLVTVRCMCEADCHGWLLSTGYVTAEALPELIQDCGPGSYYALLCVYISELIELLLFSTLNPALNSESPMLEKEPQNLSQFLNGVDAPITKSFIPY